MTQLTSQIQTLTVSEHYGDTVFGLSSWFRAPNPLPPSPWTRRALTNGTSSELSSETPSAQPQTKMPRGKDGGPCLPHLPWTGLILPSSLRVRLDPLLKAS